MKASAETAALVFTGLKLLIGVLFEIYLAYKVVTSVIEVLTEAWKLGGDELAKYRDIATNAATVSTDFYQRLTKGAETAKVPMDALLETMKKLNESSADQLGGSEAQKKLTSLTDAGNFNGNSGVAQFQNADTTEQKLRAAVDLVNQAFDKGERLAGLDFAKTIFGDDTAKNLAKDQDYLNNILIAADKVSADTLISQQSIDNAVALQLKMDAAVTILEQRWHPIQNILTQLGIQFRTIWTDIVSSIAGAVDWVAKLIEKLAGYVPSGFWGFLFNAASAAGSAVGSALGPVGSLLGAGAGAIGDGLSGGDDTSAQDARTVLASRLSNPANVANAKTATLNASNRLRKDTSFDYNADDTAADTSAYDRATESLLKYVEVTKASALTVSDNVGEQEKFKAIAQLTAAALKDGTPITAALTEEMKKLGEQAGAAGLALAKAKIDNSIQFGKNTSLLSPEDVSIANQLKGIYPDVATALNSVQAAGIRTNTALSGLSSTFSGTMTTGLTDILDGTKSVGQGFTDMSKLVVRAIEEMIVKMLIVQPLMQSLQGAFGGFSLTGGPTLNSDSWSFPKFASGTDNAPGGWSLVGEKGPEFVNLPKGSQVLPNGTSPGGTSVHAPVTIQIDATGADAAGLARVQQQIASLQATLPATIVATVQKAKSNRVL